MNLPRFKKDLGDPAHRRQLLRGAIEEARKLYSTSTPEQAREPLLRLQEQFDEAELDRLELLYRADREFPEDPYWLAAIAALLMTRATLKADEIRHLIRYGYKAPKHIETWSRVFREIKALGLPELLDEARERCALALLPFFPGPDESLWEGAGLEEEALRLMRASLDSSVEKILEQDRRDSSARQIIEAVVRHRPDHTQAQRQLARIIVSEDRPTREKVALVMEALLEDPSNVDMKLWVAVGLLAVPGHNTEGMAILRQLRQELPSDPRIEQRLIEALREGEEVTAEDIPLLLKHRARAPGDLRILELIADYYAQSESLDTEALSAYRAAAAQCRRRITYLRLLGRASVTRSDWNDVIEIFDQLRAEGEEGEDVIVPLALAYAGQGRRTGDAIEVYRKAIELGTRQLEVHSVYCQYLYETARHSPESVRQFTASLADCPDCDWAQLGILHHYLNTADYPRALEGALKLIEKQPRDREAILIAGASLAADFSRRQLARLANVQPEALRRVFEAAHKLQPEAGPLLLGLARRRLADGLRDGETAQLLREACRHYPEAFDLRVERADLLWQLGEEDNAVGIYRELLGRWRATSVMNLPKGVTPELRRRLLFRSANYLSEKPELIDLEILMDAAAEPGAPPDIVVAAAHALVTLQADHPARIPLLEQALRIEPQDVTLEKALAEGLAARGRPAPAVRLAIRLAEMELADEEAASLLRSAHAAQRPQDMPPALLTTLRAAIMELKTPVPAVALAAMELILSIRPPEEEDIPLLDYLAQILPKNLRVRRWLARALSAAGQDSKAADIYATLIGSGDPDAEVVVEMARTHAQLGMRDRANLKVAEAAVQVQPNDPELVLHLAGIELDIGHIATAARHLDKVLEENPQLHPRVLALLENTPMLQTDSRRVLPLMARVHIKAGRHEEALAILARMQTNYQRHFGDMMALYDELITVSPDNPRPRIERAVLYRLAGRMDEAIADMSAAHQLAPGSASILADYGELLAQKVRSQPDAETGVYAADILLRAGHEPQALDMLKFALEANPNHDPALRLKASIDLAAGRISDCHDALRLLTDKAMAVPVFEQLARAYADCGDHLRAAQVLTDCIEVAGPKRELLEQLRGLHEEQERARRDGAIRERIMGALSDRARRRYELREEIGSGAMGVVYKAYDHELDEIVVLKILPEHFAEDPEALAQFRNEAKAARKLAHPNIVRIHDFGEDGGRKHISMEYVSGGDLKQLLAREGTLITHQERLRIVREIVRALAHAHGEGVLHRDIKTANILLTPSRRVKLSDFGIAALLSGDAPLPDDSHYVFGTPIYMSPEQFRGERATPATDLYSVGILLYELMAGQPPFTRGSLSYHHQFSKIEPLQDIPPELWAIIERLTQKNAEARYQSAEEVLQALAPFFDEGRGEGMG